eukprot:2590741-Pleurochrysis_carterae.AAC.1
MRRGMVDPQAGCGWVELRGKERASAKSLRRTGADGKDQRQSEGVLGRRISGWDREARIWGRERT